MTPDLLAERANVHRERLQTALDGDSWLQEFPGRLILNEFAHRGLERSVDASLFRNVILDKMVELKVQPPSMRKILDEIAAR